MHWARGLDGQRKADLGDGRFLNPIMAGDHPDPSILKDGRDYYMTFSTFDSYPGLVIWHSRDLVNWRPVGPALTRRWEEQTSELQSTMRISYAVFCLTKIQDKIK